jgi:uncharacterized membrane protein
MRVRLILSVSLVLLAAACGPKPHDSQEGPLEAPADAPKGAPGPQAAQPQNLPPGADPDAPSSGPPPPVATPVAPPPPAPAATFAGDINLAGTEPFWSAQIRAGRITLTRAGQADVAMPNPGPVITGASAIWSGAGDGTQMMVVVEKGACSNGMSDVKFPYKASVKIGETVLKGCATKP